MTSAKVILDEEKLGMAMAHIGLENFKKAQFFLEEAHRENKNNPEVLFELAKIVDHNEKEDRNTYAYFLKYTKDFPTHHPEQLEYALQRVKLIKEAYFLKGELID